MIAVKEVFKNSNGTMVLVCDMFEDGRITEKLQSNVGNHERFEVLPVRECFTRAKTRHVVLYEEAELPRIEAIDFL